MKSNNCFVLLISLFLIVGCRKAFNKEGSKFSVSKEMFLGNWEYNSLNNQNEAINKTFKLMLQKTEYDRLEGYYCSISRNGSKIDCFSENEFNIKGFFENDTVYLKFYSSWDNADGSAKLFFNENKQLVWRLGECNGEIYLPIEIELKSVEEF